MFTETIKSKCLWSDTPISGIKSEKVPDNLLGKMFFKYQSYISGLGNLAPSMM